MIDIKQELDEAHARLPVVIDGPMPLNLQIRSISLTIAQRHVGDTCVKEGALYQQLKMDNKLGNVVSIDDVVKAALVFERYLWGEWSKGIAEHAADEVSTKIADEIEEELKKRVQEELDKKVGEDDPTRPSGGGAE